MIMMSHDVIASCVLTEVHPDLVIAINCHTINTREATKYNEEHY